MKKDTDGLEFTAFSCNDVKPLEEWHLVFDNKNCSTHVFINFEDFPKMAEALVDALKSKGISARLEIKLKEENEGDKA